MSISEQLDTTLFGTLFGGAPDHYYLIDRGGRYLAANASALATLGLTAEELSGRTWRDLGFPEAVMEVFDAERESVFATGVARRGEIRFPVVEGERDYQYTISPVPGARDDRANVIVAVRDVTEHNRVVEELRQERAHSALLHAITVAANESMTIDAAIRAALERLCQYLDWPIGHAYLRHEVSGPLASTTLWVPSDAERFRRFKEATAEIFQTAAIGYLRKILTDGEPIWLADVNTAPLFLRGDAAHAEGLVSGVLLPIRAGQEVAGVLEFFTTEPAPYDRRQLDVLNQAGLQLGRVIERHWASEQRFRALIEHANELVTIAAPDGKVLYQSPSVERFFGYRAAERLGQGGFSRFHPDDVEAAQLALQAVLAAPAASRRVEFRVCAADGSWHDVEGSFTNMCHLPSVEGVVVNARDVTEQKRHQRLVAAVAEATSRLLKEPGLAEAIQNVLGAIGIAADIDQITVVEHHRSPDGSQLLASQRFSWSRDSAANEHQRVDRRQEMPVDTREDSRYWTLKAGAVMQGTIEQFPAAQRSYYQQLGINALLSLPVFVDGDLWGSLNLGIKRPVAEQWSEASVAVLRTLADSLGSVMTNHRMSEELAERVEALAQSNAELEQFAYVASHDLQEPLRMVSSYTQLLARRYQDQLDADANEFIAYAVDGANRMQGLISDLLAYSRVGTRVKPFAPVAIERVLDQALLNLKLTIDESGATIQHSALPTVLADEGQLVQLFQNLIGNAIKFRADQSPVITITAERNEADWRFAVSDNGIGFEPEYAELIFAVFERLHAGHAYAGTGIGLAICKKVVERHKGRMWAESVLGQGATFFFTLPVSPGD